MKVMKVKIAYDDMKKKTSLFINGYDLSNAPITSIDLKIQGCEKPRVLVEFDVDELEIEGDFEVLKDIPEQHTVNVNLETKDIDINGVAKKITENFNKSSYR